MEIQGGGDRSDTKLGDLFGTAGTIQLPGDLMIQILSRLPVKSILRFKSVCRAWYSLFNHPIFIQHHCRIANSFAKMNNLLSFVIQTKKHKGDYHSLSLLLDCLGAEAEPIFIYPDLPIEGVLDNVEVMGSINGLVCLDLSTISRSDIVLWNPATRKHCHIINPERSLGMGDYFLSGFAYDQKTDIYKVVRVFFNSSKVAATARVEIYNTGTNSWRTKEIVGFPRNCYRSSVEVGGDLYWFSPYGGSTSRKPILSFDVSSEAFRFHLLPPESPSNQPYPLDLMCFTSWRLEAMGEHLVQRFCEYSDERIEKVNARKLNKSNDGGKDSFHIEKLTIEPLPDLKRIIRICGNGKIIAEDLDGKFLVFDREETKYLPRELWRGCHEFYECTESHEFYEYTESLVWPSRLA